MVPADSRRISRVLRYSGAVSLFFQFSLTGLSPAAVCLSRTIQLTEMPRFVDGPTTPRVASPQPRFGLCRVRSPLLAVSLLFSFPPATKMFQFAGFASQLLLRYSRWSGLPHSEIHESMGICPSSWLIAAYHVLRRLREPRHPLCALVSFLFFFVIFFEILFIILICNRIIAYYLLLVFDFFKSLRSIMSMCSFRVENNGFEPLTPCVQSRCSSQLS